jgi:putative endonuclease
MLANKKNGTLYIGVTSNLPARIWQHKQHSVEGFTKKYKVTQLVYFEYREDINEAILREKQLKKRKRDWKISLIERKNPSWNDLYQTILD